MKLRNWKKGTVFTTVSLLILVATALLVGASDDNQAEVILPPPDGNSDLISLLTVDTSTVDCAELVGADSTETLEDGRKVIPFKIGALEPVGSDTGRRWSDALSTPVSATVPEDALKEIQTAICQDPLLGATVAHMFAHYTVDGIKIVDLNDWLLPFTVEPDQINDLATAFIPLLDVTSPTDEQLNDAISQNLDYQELAEKLGTLLSRFSIVGIQSAHSVLNYHLANGGLVVGKLPEVELNSAQEGLPALLLEVNVKPGICLGRIGFNTGDKRPEVFGCPKTSTTTSEPTASTSLPPPPPPPTTTPGGKDASERPAQDPVVSCPSGQYADRNTGSCTSGGGSPPPTYNNSGGDSGPGAPGPGVSTPPQDPTPDPTVPTNTGPGDGYLPDPNA